MEINHLRSDELTYELEIRGLGAEGTVEIKRRTLRGAMRMEKLQHSFQLPAYTLDPVNEIRICDCKLREIEQACMTATAQDMVRFSSRLFHLMGRVNRIPFSITLASNLRSLKTRVACLVEQTRAEPAIEIEEIISVSDEPRGPFVSFATPAEEIVPPPVEITSPSPRNVRIAVSPVAPGLSVEDLELFDPLFERCPRQTGNNPDRLRSSTPTGRTDRFSHVANQTSNYSADPMPPPIMYSMNGPRSQPVAQWNLKFNGQNMSLSQFLERVEDLRRSRNVTERHLLDQAVDLFEGDALLWYRYNRSQMTSWSNLTERLKQVFRHEDYDVKLLQEIYNRTQGENEKIEIYVAILGGLFERLSTKLSESERVKILLRNLDPFFQKQLALHPPRTINEILTAGRMLESTRQRVSEFKPPPVSSKDTLEPEFAYHGSTIRRRVHTVTEESNTESLNTESRVRLRGMCWNCRERGHHFPECKKPRNRFCYKCGHRDVVMSTCPKCHPKNE